MSACDQDEICAVCGRPPHPVDDPQCMPATKPVVDQLDWALGEIKRERSRSALAIAALVYYKNECSGAEPSLSVFHKMLDLALDKFNAQPGATLKS